MSNKLHKIENTIIAPLRLWFDGGSKKNVLLVKIGFLAKADTSVYF